MKKIRLFKKLLKKHKPLTSNDLIQMASILRANQVSSKDGMIDLGSLVGATPENN